MHAQLVLCTLDMPTMPGEPFFPAYWCQCRQSERCNYKKACSHLYCLCLIPLWALGMPWASLPCSCGWEQLWWYFLGCALFCCGLWMWTAVPASSFLHWVSRQCRYTQTSEVSTVKSIETWSVLMRESVVWTNVCVCWHVVPDFDSGLYGSWFCWVLIDTMSEGCL